MDFHLIYNNSGGVGRLRKRDLFPYYLVFPSANVLHLELKTSSQTRTRTRTRIRISASTKLEGLEVNRVTQQVNHFMRNM